MRKNEYLFLHNDLMFKNTFGTEENKKLTIDMLEKLFNLEKGTLKNSIIENSVILDKKTVEEKKFELDIVVSTEYGDKINIEMQRRLDKTSEIKNFMYVTSMFSSQLKRSEKYSNIGKVIQVEFSKERQLHKNSGIISKYCMTNIDDEEDKMLENEFFVIKIDLNAKSNETNEFELWRRFIGSTDERELEELSKKEPILKEAKLAMEGFMNNEYVQDYTMDKSFIEARIEEAKETGFEDGHAEGLEEGSKNKSLEIAKEMLKHNKSVEEIMLYTKISQKELEKLRKELN